MKRLIFLVGIVFAVCLQTEYANAQKRPVKKSAPVVATPTETPQPKQTTKAISPPEAFYNEGLKCDAKDYDCQVSNYTKAINLGLSTKAVFKKRAAAYTGRQDLERSIADLTKAIELDLNDANGFKDRGRAYLAMPTNAQTIGNAIKDLSSAIDLEPKDIEALIVRGQGYVSLGDNAKGIADIQNAIRIDPKNVELLLFQARIFADYTGELDKAVDAYSKVIAVQPASAEPYQQRARIFETQKKYDLAIKDYLTLANLNKKDATPHVTLAQIYKTTGRPDEVIGEYAKAIEIAPTPDLLLQRASIYRDAKKFTEAKADIARAIEQAPRNAYAYQLRCETENESGNIIRAMEDCSIAITLNPHLSVPYLIRNEILDSQTPSVADDSEAYTEVANVWYPHVAVFYLTTELFRNRRIRASIELRKSPSALNYKNLASAQFGSTGRCWYGGRIRVGTVPLESDDSPLYCSLAETYFSKALEIDPNLGSAYAGRASARSELVLMKGVNAYKDFEEAKAILQDAQKAVELDPKQGVKLKRVIDSVMYSGEASFENNATIKMWVIKILDTAIEKNPADRELFTLRATTRAHLVKYAKTATVAQKSALKSSIESDLRHSLELYDESKGGFEGRKDFVNAIKSLVTYLAKRDREEPSVFSLTQDGGAYESDKTKRAVWESAFSDVLSKYPGNFEILVFKCSKLRIPTDCAKVTESRKLYVAERVKVIKELLSAIERGITFTNQLPSLANTEYISEMNLDRALWDEETKRMTEEDVDAKRIQASFIAKGQQDLAELKQASDAVRRRSEAADRELRETRAKGNAMLMDAFGKLGSAIITTVTTPKRTQTSTAPPITTSRPTAIPSTTNPSSTANSSSNQNSENDCPPDTGYSQTTNTGEAEPGTQNQFGWTAWQNHPGYTGLSMRSRPMFQQKGQPYWYFEMEIKNSYQEKVNVSVFTSDMCKMRNNEINELYSDGSVVTISPGGTGRETYLRSASSSSVKYWVRMYKESGNGKVAKHDDGSLPLWCQIYPGAQSCPGQP